MTLTIPYWTYSSVFCRVINIIFINVKVFQEMLLEMPACSDLHCYMQNVFFLMITLSVLFNNMVFELLHLSHAFYLVYQETLSFLSAWNDNNIICQTFFPNLH